MLKILVVDDEPDVSQLVRQKFRRRMREGEIDFVYAYDGVEALDALDHGAYDVVLMDVHMPEMDGYAATAAIRAREQQTGERLPIIAMTANAMEGDRDACLQAGMDDYISKPVKPHRLEAVLEKWSTLSLTVQGSRHLTIES